VYFGILNRLNLRKQTPFLKLLVLGISLPLYGQYAGPAILSRGEAPTAMASPSINFQPFVEVAGIYDTGLAGVVVTDANGDLANGASGGIALSWGISGAYSWRHTHVGLSYRGGLSHYAQQTFYDSIEQQLFLGVTHELSKHVKLSLRESAGEFSAGTQFTNLQSTLPFDPATSYTPMTDFFDNRTVYLTSQGDLTLQKTARLSFNVGGDFFINRRRSNALASVTGEAARGDVQYRISRRTTIGANYQYERFSYSNFQSQSDMHSFTGSYAVRLTRRLEFSSTAGVTRGETKYTQALAVDPVIQALLGISTVTEIVHRIDYLPDIQARLSRTVPHGYVFVSAGYGVTPGNGLFLTSYQTTVLGGYTYTGLRRWSFSSQASYARARSISNYAGIYGDYSGGFSLSRQLRHGVHAVAQYVISKYDSPDFNKYNRVVNEARVGVGFTPGDVPLRIW
jgi:hypothetical protein